MKEWAKKGQKKSLKQIWHVYYGTRGLSGAYIDALQRAFQEIGIGSRAFVSCGYVYKTAGITRVFFFVTDSYAVPPQMRRALRAIELVLSYGIVFAASIFVRPAINIHLTDDYAATWLLFRACKLIRLKVFVTCHDVASHVGGLCWRRLDILKRADLLIVHNRTSERYVHASCESHVGRVARYPYPYSCYDSILSQARMASVESRWEAQIGSTPFFCFLGIVRMSKGIETLLQAWNDFEEKKGFQLVIAGKWADTADLKRKAANLRNCIIEDRYLTEEEYVYMVRRSAFMVLPYNNGYSHSAILMSCARHGGVVIVSDAEMFKEILGNYDLAFKAGDSKELSRVLTRAIEMSSIERNRCRELLRSVIETEDNNLLVGLKSVFQSTLQ